MKEQGWFLFVKPSTHYLKSQPRFPMEEQG